MDGLRVLIVEDCYLMASAIEDMLIDAGAVVVGTTKSVASALQILVTQAVDVACLDINLGWENSFPVADDLASRGVPFVFVTSYDATMLPPRHRNQPLVDKMAVVDELVAACQVAARRARPIQPPPGLALADMALPASAQ